MARQGVDPAKQSNKYKERVKMKKFLILSAMAGAMAFAVPSIEAKTTAAPASAGSAEPQINVRIGQPRRNRWNNRQRRTVTTTRVTRVGRFRYRETIRTTYLPNGRTR